ncbi:MAG: retropepsin-like domain-containing protein [Tannerella sp.]|jgi:predicted aspartyl protease|nr:retropepsin-like domain-containing protein [Tannerella sp.]
MKKTILLLNSIFLLFACSNGASDAKFDKQLSKLLENKDFFKLRTELENVKGKLSEDRLLYYKMWCEMAFGNRQQSNNYAAILLDKYGKLQNDTTTADILGIKASNCIYAYQYKEAADIYDTLLKQYENVLDSSEIVNYKNVKLLFSTLSKVKPQQMHKYGDREIETYRNQFNHLIIPVKCDGIADEFVFDTGANFSVITNSCASKMGLTVFDSDIKVGTSTSFSVQTQLTVADSFYVGDILFENVVFLVVPAEQMTFPSVNLEIHGIIGFPVLNQMDEVHLQKDGKIFIPEEPQNKNLNNMFLHGLNPVVQLFSENDTLQFTFDTGARTTELSKKYFDSHKMEIEQKGTLQKGKKGSAGGVIEVDEYILPDFPYRIGSKSGTLPNVSVSLNEYDFNKSFDGNLGQDIITQFNALILNFKYMYIEFE